MKTALGYDLIPRRAWGSNTKVSLAITGPDEALHATVVDDWRSIVRAMSLTKGGWRVPDTAVQIALTPENVRSLEDEIRALGLT